MLKFLKKNMFTLLALTVVFALAFVGDASAASVMDTAKEKAVKVFLAVKTIVFVIGGFGLVALAFQAIFGKVKWPWFAGLAVGLGILAAAGAIVEYATGDSSGISTDLEDTFGDN